MWELALGDCAWPNLRLEHRILELLAQWHLNKGGARNRSLIFEDFVIWKVLTLIGVKSEVVVNCRYFKRIWKRGMDSVIITSSFRIRTVQILELGARSNLPPFQKLKYCCNVISCSCKEPSVELISFITSPSMISSTSSISQQNEHQAINRARCATSVQWSVQRLQFS